MPDACAKTLPRKGGLGVEVEEASGHVSLLCAGFFASLDACGWKPRKYRFICNSHAGGAGFEDQEHARYACRQSAGPS